MTLTRSWVTGAPTTPLDARLMLMSLIVANADGTPRAGVLTSAPSIVTTTGTMNVAVAAAEFATTKGRADGVTILANDGSVNVAISAAPVSNSRITSIWVKHNNATTGDGDSLPVFGTTDGTSGASPTAPSVPTGATELAQLRIYSGTTATNGGSNTLTNTYTRTAARGGVVPVRTTTERDAWASPIDGQRVYVEATDQTYQYVTSTIGWVHAGGPPTSTALTYAGIYSAYTAPHTPRVLEQNGRINLEGSIQSTSATFAANTNYSLGSVPVALAITAERSYPITYQAGAANFAGMLTVQTTGALLFTPFVAHTTLALIFRLNGIGWPDKRLA